MPYEVADGIGISLCLNQIFAIPYITREVTAVSVKAGSVLGEFVDESPPGATDQALDFEDLFGSWHSRGQLLHVYMTNDEV